MKFAQLGLIEPLIRAVTKAGHASPTPIQALAIPEAVAGKDVLGAAETGTGKTAAFALPVLQRLSQSTPPKHPLSRRVRALVITANRDLAAGIGAEFTIYGRYLGLNHLTLVNSTDASQIASPLRSVDILITTPEKLVELHLHGGVDLRAVEILVIDEVDRMLDLGCMADVQRIVSQLPLDRQTLLFTATMPNAINTLADSMLRNPARIRIPPTQKAAEIIQQSVCFVGRPQKTSLLVAWLGQRSVTRTVVFTRTRQGADRVVRQLLSCGIRAEAIHGEKTQAARQQTLVRFKSAQPPVLVATDLAARGIDVDTISYVVNYDLPMEPETYIHRIGRIARAGSKGVSVTFCDESERVLLKGIERLLRREIPVDDSTRPLDKLPRIKPAVTEPLPTPKRPSRSRRAAVAVVIEEVPLEPAPVRPAATRSRSAAAAAPVEAKPHHPTNATPRKAGSAGRTGGTAGQTSASTRTRSGGRAAANGHAAKEHAPKTRSAGSQRTAESSKKAAATPRGAVAARRR